MKKVLPHIKEFFRRADMLLFSLSLICALFGLVVIWSATQHLDNPARYVIVQSLGIFIGVAAVADWRVADRLEGKWKKDAGLPQLRLVENPDILAAVGHRAGGPVTIGFAAEATDLLENAYAKLEKKGAAMIVANVARDALASDTNRVLVVTDGEVDEIGPADKDEVARKILYHAVDLLEEDYGPEDDL